MKSLVVLALLAYSSSSVLVLQVQATISVIGTSLRYSSRQDSRDKSKQLWRGYEYMADLQFLPGNLELCPYDSSSSPNNKIHNITVPEDGMPVALLVRNGGGTGSARCSFRDKVNFALTQLYPPGVVKYLLIEDSTVPISLNSIEVPESEAPQVAQQQQERLLKSSSAASHVVLQGNDDEEIPLYVVYISTRTHMDLLQYLLHIDPSVVAQGGPRISIDTRNPNGFFESGEGAIWIALSALLSACACSFLLVAGGNQQGWWFQAEEEHHHPPVRPSRRRLTREQVKRLLPQWRYDGTALRSLEEETAASSNALLQHQQQQPLGEGRTSEEEGLFTTSSLVASVGAAICCPPEPVELSLCSICLDDYEAGDKLRCLPCNHAFHAKCIGKWLAERSATCPLCKTEIWDGEEGEQDEEGQHRQSVTHIPPPPRREYGANSWDRAWHQYFTRSQQQQQQRPRMQQQGPSGAVAEAAETDMMVTLEEGIHHAPSSSRGTWWRQLSSFLPYQARSQHGGMLTEPLLPRGGSSAIEATMGGGQHEAELLPLSSPSSRTISTATTSRDGVIVPTTSPSSEAAAAANASHDSNNSRISTSTEVGCVTDGRTTTTQSNDSSPSSITHPSVTSSSFLPSQHRASV